MGSFKTRGNFQKIRELWPLIPAGTIFYLNIDWMVTPFLINCRIPISELLPIEYVLSTLELIFWFWFWSWVWDLFKKAVVHTKTAQEDLKLVKSFWAVLKERGILAAAKDLLFKIIDGASNEKNIIIRFIKWGGAFSLILIGASPESGSRIVGVIFCKMSRWKKGFYPLAFGNLIHITYIVLGWKYSGVFRMIMFFITVAILSYVVKKVLVKK